MTGLPREADLTAGVVELWVADNLGDSHSRGFD